MHPTTQESCTIAIHGPFDALAAERMRNKFENIISAGEEDVILDLTGVDFVDSSGIGAIVFLYKRLTSQSRMLQLSGLHGQPRDLFKFLRIDRTIKLIDPVALH